MNKIKTIFPLFLLLLSGSVAFGQCSDLFFSEMIEGSSSNKALEIFNPSDTTVDLTQYVVYRYNNGSQTATDSLFPQGTLDSDSVFVIANPSANAAIQAEQDTTHTLTFYNGDDAIALINMFTGDTLDIIGVIGVDPGSGWTVGTGATNNTTLIRNRTVQDGETDWNIAVTQWDVYAIDVVDSLGFHNYDKCNSGPGCSDDLFFSEYIEGSSSNKCFEIYNPMDTVVDLSGYVVYRYNNGSLTATDSLFPQGMLEPDSVFITANPSANVPIQAVADTTHTITFYNGDDAMSLINMTTGDTLDIIGIIGVDPGSGWTVGTGATNNNTLIRQRTVQQGETDWTIGATQWDVYAIDMVDSLNFHTMDPCGGAVVPMVSFFGSGSREPEGAGTVSLQLSITNPDPNTAYSVDVALNAGGSTATSGSDFNFTNTTVTFPMGTTANQTITVDILQDVLTENDEDIVLELSNPTNGAMISVGTYTLTIEDDDIATYPIGTINTVDTAGVADSAGVTCWIEGIVYGVNMRPSGLQFTIIDQTGGIGLFDFSAVSGYVVQESDSIAVLGTIGQFNGLTQINPDSIIFFTTGNTLKTANVVTTLSEATESDLTRFNNATLVDPAQWAPGGSGFNVDVTNGTDTIVVRIDADVDLFNAPAPVGTFDVCGLGGQFDSSSPYLDGYQLLPRYMADIKGGAAVMVDLGADTTICDNATLTLDAGNAGATYAWSTGDSTQTITVGGGTYSVTVDLNGVTAVDTIVVNTIPSPVAGFTCDSSAAPTYAFTNTSTNANSYAWDFGDGGTSTLTDPTYTYAVSGNYTITLVATGLCGNDTTTKGVSVSVGIEELMEGAVELYPNPSNGLFNVRFSGVSGSVSLQVTDLAGKLVYSATDRDVAQGEVKQVQLNGLSEGMYFLKVNVNDKVAVKRVVIH